MMFRDILKLKLEADLGPFLYFAGNAPDVRFKIIARENGILCGIECVPMIIEIVEREVFLGTERTQHVAVTLLKKDGDKIERDDVLAELYGNAEVLLKAERTICNILSELSGIATRTREVVNAAGELTVLDTRKDDSLMRPAHQYAVRIGGGANHRVGIYDGVLVKDNDIAVYRGIENAIDKRMPEKRHLAKLEVEVATLDELREVLKDGRADGILLDNMDIETMREAVSIIRASEDAKKESYFIEASGVSGMNLKEIAATGVDCVSMSSLIRGARYVDISMKAM